ncbi:MAG: mechanosensitive ion channel [Gammaproteobacteria bacterium]|nr:mechanosensitive ion channel [Gammaproteobacteria bacterium]
MIEGESQLTTGAADLWRWLVEYLGQPWFAYQVVIMVGLYFAARIVSARVKPRIEERVREIKGNPALLRLIAPLLRKTQLIIFVTLLFLTLLVMRSLTWPSYSYVISVVLSLTFAWLLISILSRMIHSRAIGRMVAVAVWAYVAVSILGIGDNVASFLEGIGFSVGDLRISALLLLKAAVLLTVTLWLAIYAGNFLENRIQRSEELTPSLRVLFGKLLKITLIVMAAVFAMSGLGIDLTAFTIFSGAVGVGIGFGLQKVVSNFISGIIILMDRSIKPGDTISLGETFGWIRELRARFVSVVTRDGREYLIPNEDFITREVINWSFSNELVRLDVPFGVSYDSDPHKVTELAIEAASKVDRVVQSKDPVCWLTGFGDSSLEFLLRFWINDPQNGITNIRGKVLLAMWDSFRANGIGIPYPHREVIFKTPIQLAGQRTGDGNEPPSVTGTDDADRQSSSGIP